MSADYSLPKLSQREIASLIVLMATARELTNPELVELAGFDLVGTSRRKLNDLGLVASRKVGQPYAHKLTAEGWRVSRELLTLERPARAGSFGGALFALLGALAAGLDRHGLSPAEFFGPHRERHAPEQAQPSPTTDADIAESAVPSETRGRATSEPVAAEPADVESAIRAAYSGLTEREGDWVGLAPLRAQLGTFDRAEVDRALRRLAVEPGVHIIPVANLKSLTPEDREAALRLGGEDNHAIAIETR